MWLWFRRLVTLASWRKRSNQVLHDRPAHRVRAALALDLDDWRLQAERILVGDDVHAAVAGSLRDSGAVAHALQEVRDEVLELGPL